VSQSLPRLHNTHDRCVHLVPPLQLDGFLLVLDIRQASGM
jgi:hypothetical protein